VQQNSENLIWIDLEMTGLDTQNDMIIEIATLITDSNLNLVEEGPTIAIHQPDPILAGMDEWNTRQHGQSGLTKRVRESRVTAGEAEEKTLQFIAKHVPSGVSPMCGNSICQDRRFLSRLMPKLESYFHYRNLDVSTFKELAKRWAPTTAKGFVKESQHLAMQDIRDSVEELRYYRTHLWREEPSSSSEPEKKP
jgi:oligoribonuclease